MILSNEKIGDTLIASVAGQVNSANAGNLESQLLQLVAIGEHRLVLDLSRLDYISSAGLRVALILAKRIREKGGRLAFYGMQPHVHEVFDISGFLAILTVVDTRADALAQVAA